jgi:hypothetical protein
VDTKSKFVFYNRVPKCGSTTMVSMMDEMMQAKGEVRGKHWTGFTFVQSPDFDEAHFQPEYDTRKKIVREMTGHSAQLQKSTPVHSGKTLFERHIHFIDFNEFKEPNPVYINVLRDPADLRASGYYFYRDCVCNQVPAHGDDFADEWCKADWGKKSPQFCGLDINQCYTDLDTCRGMGMSLGGSELTDFICGASSGDCEDPGAGLVGKEEFTSSEAKRVKWSDKFEKKVARAISNVRYHYRWVGLLEYLEDSLQLLHHMLPDYFGKLDAHKWGNMDVAPDGSDGSVTHSYAKPNVATKEYMMSDPYFQMEMKLYNYAKHSLACKMESCGIKAVTLKVGGKGSSPDLEVQGDKMSRRMGNSTNP